MQNIEVSGSPGNIYMYHREGFTLRRRQDKIIHLEFHEGYQLTLEDARHQMDIISKLRGEEKCLLLAVFSEDSTFSREVRDFIASDEVSGMLMADALVVKGLALKILTNGYLQINRPGRPSRVFNGIGPAIRWLQSFSPVIN